jgi:hypothetical protein
MGRAGRLRHSKRAGKVLILGEWVLQWLRDGERKRPAEMITDKEE